MGRRVLCFLCGSFYGTHGKIPDVRTKARFAGRRRRCLRLHTEGSGFDSYELLANRIQNAVQARRNAQRADRQEELMRLTEAAGKAGGFEVDFGTGNLTLTDGARRLAGISEDGKICLEDAIGMYRPEDTKRLRDAIDRVAERKETDQGTYRSMTEGGDEGLVEITTTPVTKDGEVIKKPLRRWVIKSTKPWGTTAGSYRAKTPTRRGSPPCVRPSTTRNLPPSNCAATARTARSSGTAWRSTHLYSPPTANACRTSSPASKRATTVPPRERRGRIGPSAASGPAAAARVRVVGWHRPAVGGVVLATGLFPGRPEVCGSVVPTGGGRFLRVALSAPVSAEYPRDLVGPTEEEPGDGHDVDGRRGACHRDES
jgi:hypothetical protein